MLYKEYQGKQNNDLSATKWFKKMGYTAHPATGASLVRIPSEGQNSASLRAVSELSGLPPPRGGSTLSANVPSILSAAALDLGEDAQASRCSRVSPSALSAAAPFNATPPLG